MHIPGSLIVITGASSGIGAATARLLAARGARVVLLARSAESLTTLTADITAHGGSAACYAADLGDAAAAQAACAALLAQHGAPDAVVHSAGAGRMLFLDEGDSAEIDRTMRAPYFAAAHVTHFLLPAMRARNRGVLAFINSPASLMPWPGATAYAAARWALRGLVLGLRQDLRHTKIKVVEIIPGKVASGYFHANGGAEARLPGISRLFGELTTDESARHIVRALQREPRLTIFPRRLRAAMWLHRLLPSVVQWVVGATGARREKV